MAEFELGSNGNISHNGTPPSPLAEGLAIWDGWEGMTQLEKLKTILESCPREQWTDASPLEVLASFRDAPPGMWSKICDKYVSLGGSQLRLEQAVGQELAMQAVLGTGEHALFLDAADIPDEEIAWLWEPYIARGTMTILDGDPGAGKTMFACQLAASLSKGFPLPDQAGHMTAGNHEPANVFMIAMEDPLGAVVKKRLEKCGADMRRVKILQGMVNAKGELKEFTLENLNKLQTKMQESQPALIYIDAIQSVLGEKVDIGSPNKVKSLLLPLQRLAQGFRCAVVFSRHPSKPGQNTARLIHRGMGSQSFIGSARSGLFVEQDPGDRTRSLLIHYKNNMGVIGQTHLFSKAGGVFEWAGVSRVTESVLAGAGRGPNPYALLEACFWLEKALGGGYPRPASELEEQADVDDIGTGALKRARKVLGVVATQAGGQLHAGWMWYLPPLTTAPTGATEPTGATDATDTPEEISMTYEDSLGQKGHVVSSGDTVASETSEGPEVSEGPIASAESRVIEPTDATDTPEEISMTYEDKDAVPCVVCGGNGRWDDHGVLRCTTCWPPAQRARGKE